jgi:predicted phosphodiesterase
MNIITIGDLHGSKAWKKVQLEEWDHVIFMGDYVDSFDYKDKEILENLMDVIRLKKNNPEKVVLLWGNHDVAYLFKGKSPHGCSGFRYSMLPALNELFMQNRSIFLLAWQLNKYLWTHAGIVQRWHQSYPEKIVIPEDINLAGTLNRLFDEYYLPLFHVGPLRGGDDKDSGPFWADYAETIKDPLTGYHQIVGHTHTRNGIIHFKHPDGISFVSYTDCLDTKTEFHTLNL